MPPDDNDPYVIPLSKTAVRILDDCIKRAIIKNFKVRDNDNIDEIRLNCDLSHISTMIERRQIKFVNKLLDCSCWTCHFILSLKF